ncbi:MAG TPA: UvrD-helicase domain-containing protein [Euzebyales bacterium]|nr:UvrD-helicase domain-containing protein [Euzebyales bacterium]
MSEIAELRREQEHVDRAYARLDVLRERARRRSAGVLRQGRGGTHQARHDRDAFVRSSLHRLEQLNAAEYGLVFGRLDEDDGDVWHVGRLGVNDDDYEPLVVDWRAPVAAPFYRATPLEPLGIRRRRHLHMRGREVVRLDDELMDASLAAADDVVLVGEGALLAAVARPRSDRMTDIVATIQREQDDVIRAPLEGVTVVQGGPGTGKTAVALHRVAYLLYANRERIEHLGVLVIGPSARFLRYIGDVLPGLGEEAVRLARIGDLLGDGVVAAHDPPGVRRVKGDPRMATVVARLVRDWPWDTVGEDDWDELAETLLRTLLTDPAVLRRAGGDVLPAGDLELLAEHRGTGWSEADVALLDEIAALVARRRPRRRRPAGADQPRLEETLDVLGLDSAMRAAARARMQRQVEVGVARREEVYGHVVVDEAQELSPMQWRMLTRRCPSGSMTVVGDLDQAMRPDPISDWSQLAAQLPSRPRIFELTVNYRTPAEIMAYVERQREITGVRRRAPRSVRFSGREPAVRVVARRDTVAGIARVHAELAHAPGTQVVIAASTRVAELRAGLGDRVVCLSPRGAKGLEFDAVVLVEPGEIARQDGGAAVYVAMTRATRDLIVLHDDDGG